MAQQPPPGCTQSNDLIAFVDEAGSKGLARNLHPGRDDEVGVMTALVMPISDVDRLRDAFRVGFNKFCAAAPANATWHVTDAFLPENQAWRVVAESVRQDFFTLIAQEKLTVVYDARRLKLAREGHERTEDLVAAVRSNPSRSNIRVPVRPNTERVEGHLFEGLTLKLDAFAQDNGYDQVQLQFDEIDNALKADYEKALGRLRQISGNTQNVKGRDMAAEKSVFGQIAISVSVSGNDLKLDVTHIGNIGVAGKSDPLILAVDIVANALFRHLDGLPAYALLNAPSSVTAWPLGAHVYGVRDDAIEDLI
jgi:hypothetical protein